MKKHPNEWAQFANHLSDKNLISKIYTELQVSKKKLINKWANGFKKMDLNRDFSKKKKGWSKAT